MATANLTKRTIDALDFEPACDYFVWDTKLKGFGIRVTERVDKSGVTQRRKVFVVGYRPKGARQFKRLAIGVFGPMTPDQARTEALRHLSAISVGNDPMTARRAAKAERTIKDVGTAYLEEVERRRKKTTFVEYERLWNKHVVPAIGTKQVSAIEPADMRKLHRSMSETPYIANRVLAMVSAFFTFAEREDARKPHTNPVRGIEFYQETPRERFLTVEEYGRLGAALVKAETEGLPPAPKKKRKAPSEKTAKHRPKIADKPIPADPYAIAAIRLLLLTGCREGEILSLRHDAVDFERGHLRLSDTKTGKSIRPLSASAAELIKSLDTLEDNPFVLPGRKPGKHLTQIDRLWHAVRLEAKLEDVRIHDLRHSFASVPATSGESMLVLRTLLGHKRVSTTERYAHLGDDPVKRAADKASGDIAGWLGKSRATASNGTGLTAHAHENSNR